MTSTPPRIPARRPATALLSAAVLALALGSAGCGKIGCFEMSEAELEDFYGGSCPSQEEAQAFFGDPGCGGEVESVDSEGEYDGGYCCYEITKVSADQIYYCPVQ
jgi:hypothetical protein